jgi:serine/threonine protein kinase/tetratricopeptide (TPR) repeat protein
MKCPKCDSDNTAVARFCSNCATSLTGAEEAQPLPTQTIETPREELTTGSTFAGRYQIIEELGKGGMGKVYKAVDTRIKEKIALKLIKPEIASDKKTLERFGNELKLARKITHKNVGKMFDINEEQGTHYITMEYVPGQDLKGLIKQTGQLAVGTSISIAKQICQGLSEAHKAGVIHRDLKPNNIMIDREGEVRIMDFGIARSLKEKGITGAGVMIGTPEYMSPEQAEAKEVDHRSDIYSLGVMLYEMVTGRIPFEGDTALSIAMKHKGEIPRNPKEYNSQIPDELSGVVLKCLAKEKDERPKSVEELLSGLNNIEKGIPTTDRVIPTRKPITSKEITVSFPAKRILLAAVVVIVFAFIGLLLWQPWSQKVTSIRSSLRPSVAVLPFEDFSPQKDQEYLCLGIASELINRLNKIHDLWVPARGSSFFFRGSEANIQQIGNSLNVQSILMGTLMKSGNKIRISVELVDVVENEIIWSDTYERNEGDIFDLQDDVTLAIVEKLKVNLLGEESAALVKRYTENVEAYNLYLKGRYFWSQDTKAGFDQSLEYYKQAIEIEPLYALAYAGMADSYLSYAFNGNSPRKAVMPQAEAAASKALEIDNTLSEAHASMAFIKILNDWSWSEGEREIKRAIDLNPSNALAHFYYSWLLTFIARHDEAIVEMKRAHELDPLSIDFHIGLGRRYYYARRFDEALEEFRKVLDFDPNADTARIWIGMTYAHIGKIEDAVAEIMRATDDQSWFRGYILGVAGRKDEALKILNIRLERSKHEFVWPATIAFIYIGLGDKEEALRWLEITFEEREAWMDLLKVEPIYDSLRSDPRFQTLIKRMNYPD